ncbi:EcsC family protein [Clostridium oceanicum]|uniref:EcsC family protein n=1 Tax=Clostridium oceanicum TaxID=1543 RepID=A0ABP3UVL0_9CLOT
MDIYEIEAMRELKSWQKKMSKKPSIIDKTTKSMQGKFNSFIPEKAHRIITASIKSMTKVVILGSEFVSKPPLKMVNLKYREDLVRDKIDSYRKTAATTGAGTGFGGIVLGMADFPILLSIKIKFLFDVASIYGFDVKDYRERLYILYIFQLAFSSQEKRNEIYYKILNWDSYVKTLPINKDDFNWREFQQEYRDYMDIAKMLQLVPGIGAVVGAYANYKLVSKLGETAMNSYRVRIL